MDPIHSQYNSLHSHLPTKNDGNFTALTIKIEIYKDNTITNLHKLCLPYESISSFRPLLPHLVEFYSQMSCMFPMEASMLLPAY